MTRQFFALLFASLIAFGSLPAIATAEVTKENIESGTTDYRIVRYTRANNALTCTAMVCERRDSHRCGTQDGLFSVSKRTEEDLVYISYYPAEREASRKLHTEIRIGGFQSRSFLPIQDYPETWIVPDIVTNEDMIYEIERENRTGPVDISIQTETFSQKFMRMVDYNGMKRDVTRLCPTKG